MTILLNIDDVLITMPPWQQTGVLPDGFAPFNKKAATNLERLITQTDAAVVLTTTHRISYNMVEWKAIFKTRSIDIARLSNINDRSSVSVMPSRNVEIEEWVAKYGDEENYVIIDDDDSLHDLPPDIKSHWVMIKPMLGLDDEATTTALSILKNKPAT